MLDGAQGILALVGGAAADDCLSHAAARAEDLRRAGAHAVGQVGGFLLQHLEADAGLLHHLHDLLRGEHKVDVGDAVGVAELLAPRLHLLGGAGHDGDVEGRAAVLGVLLAVVFLEHGRKHLHGGAGGGEILQKFGPLVFHILHPRGAAGGHQRQVLAGFEPTQELGGFLAHGEVRAEDGVVHLVRAHDLERGDELIEHVFARGEAVGFADGDAHGGRDLNDDSLLRVLQGFPRGANVVLDGDGAGGTHGGALSAADAVRLAQGLIVRRGDVQAWAAAGKAQIADALHLVADAHTVAAEDALVEVHRDGGAGEVHLDVLARIVEADVVDAEANRHLLQTAGAVLLAGGAVAAMRGEQQLDDHAAVLEQPRRVGADVQLVFRRHGAGRVDLSGALLLDHAHTARAVNGQIGMEAEVGNLNAGLAADLEHVGFVVIFHADVVHVHNALRHRAPPP